jgi:hypothetical protein
MALAYTLLAILGLVAFSLLTAWFIGKGLNYAAQTHEQVEREFANADYAYGDVAFIPEGLRPAHIATEQNERACTQVTQLRLPSTPPSCGR